jgi:hypothetical protein
MGWQKWVGGHISIFIVKQACCYLMEARFGDFYYDIPMFEFKIALLSE